MTTRARLEEMTDAGAFERLATAVLRKADYGCAALVHPGVNAAGRPAPARVDGFQVLGEDPSGRVLCAHTTMSLARLPTKWLDPDVGDIPKAAAAARAAGTTSGRLVLTTNREPSLELVAAARDACAAEGFALELWSQSRIADFLDDDPEGQWIRRRFFGEPETRLALSALREIAEDGPVDVPVFDPSAALAPRATTEDLAAQLRAGRRLLLLAAASGQGKTVVATDVWRRMAAAGDLAVHVAHDDVEATVTLEEALARALRRRFPGLTSQCGREALAIAETHVLLVLVEDINRSARPSAALQKVVAWSRQCRAAGLRVLCPIWPRALAALPEQDQRAIAGAVTWLDLPSESEAIGMAAKQAAAQGVSPTPNDLFRVVRSLGRDPLLLGAHDYRGGSSDGLAAFVNRVARRVASAAGLATADLHEALDALAMAMLDARALEPRWRDVRGVAGPDLTLRLLRLLEDGSLVRLSGDGADERLLFRHDRVRDQIRAIGLRRRIEAEPQAEVLNEPAYAELWGILLGDPETPETWIALAAERNPLGLFHGLAVCPRSAAARRGALAAAAAAWLDAEGHSAANDHLRWAAQWAVMEVEAPDVRDLLPAFGETTWMIREAAFLNGDMEAGLQITASWDPFRLSGRERRLFDHVRATRLETVRCFIAAGLADPDATPQRLHAILGMAGRMRDPGLEPALEAAWARIPKTPDLIDASLWGFALCAPRGLPKVLDAWASLGDERDEGGRTPRGRVGYDTRAGLWELAGPETLTAFLGRDPELGDPLFWGILSLLEGWDHPDGQEQLARRLAKTVGSGFISFVTTHAGEMWSQERPRGGRTMSAASKDRLQALWSDASEDVEVRRMALRVWSGAARTGQAQPLRAIDPMGPVGVAAVRARIMLSDPEAPAALEALVERDPTHGWLWQYVRGRWLDSYSPGLERLLDQRRELKAAGALEQFRADHAVPDLLKELDDELRTQLLHTHWDHLGDDYGYVQLALWTATPESLRLAKRSLDSTDPRKLLNFLSMHYGLYRESRPATSELRRLKALEPWLDHLDAHCLDRLAEHCNRAGWRDWRREHLDPRLGTSNRDRWRTADGRRQEFDNIADKDDRSPFLRITVEQMVEAEGDIEIIFAEADAWLTVRRDLPALRVACGLVVEGGARSGLPRLESWRRLALKGGDAVIDDAVFALKRRTLD